MNKDIVFINPLAHVRYEFNPLGVQLLAKSCKDNGFNANIIDLANDFIKENKIFDNSTKKWIEDKIKDIDSDIIGITVMNASLPWVEYIIKVIKNEDKNKKIILGGPQVTALQSELFKLFGNQVDYLVVYEGEQVIVRLIEFIKSKKSVSDLPNKLIEAKSKLKVEQLRDDRTRDLFLESLSDEEQNRIAFVGSKWFRTKFLEEIKYYFEIRNKKMSCEMFEEIVEFVEKSYSNVPIDVSILTAIPYKLRGFVYINR